MFSKSLENFKIYYKIIYFNSEVKFTNLIKILAILISILPFGFESYLRSLDKY